MTNENSMDLKNPDETCVYCQKILKHDKSVKYFCELQHNAIGGDCKDCRNKKGA